MKDLYFDDISLETLLKGRNVNGDLYDTDIHRFLGMKLLDKKHEEVKSAFRKMAGIKLWEK